MAYEFQSKEEYFEFFHNEIKAIARIKDDEKLEEEVFTEKMLDYLNDSNFTENAVPCRHKGRGFKVDGYDMNSTENAIDIIVTLYDNDKDEIFKVAKLDITKTHKWARNFLNQSRIGSGLHDKLEDSAEAYDLAKLIHKNFKNLKIARIILITNGETGAIPAEIDKAGNMEITFQVYDFERLWRNISSGMKKEVITLDFGKEGLEPVPTISAYDGKGIYKTYISLIPGSLIRSLYNRYGTRLLERNVRAFLQARSKVNQGIRDTIIQTPNMFLAYNNGITVTAQEVVTITDDYGNEKITSIKDFQIVNGGQTCASLWHTSTKNKAELKNVFLQMKLTVLNNPEMIDEIAPKISKYSNAQNAVNTADFSANSPLHRNIEKVGNSIWAPDPTGGNRNTKWFYERARGSYFETRALERTPAKIKAWDIIHPRNQNFDKLVLAKIENTWRLLPYEVSLGGQKCFSKFTVYVEERIAADNDIVVDEKYFKHLIAKIIIWKSTEKLINKQKMPGYRANIVTYSLSWILQHHPEIFNLNKIWNNQVIDHDLAAVINLVAYRIRNVITNVEGNVTEYCKKVVCWEKVQKLNIDITKADSIDPEQEQLKEEVRPQATIDWSIFEVSDIWLKAAEWIEETKRLPEEDASFCRSIWKTLENRRNPSLKQIPIAFKIIENAVKKGFKI